MLLLTPALAWAGQGYEDVELALRVFGTLGAVRSSSDQAEFLRDLSQPRGSAGAWHGRTDSLLGVQANVRVSEHIEAVAQVMSRNHDLGSYEPTLEWGFVSLEPSPATTLRLGRLGTDFYINGDSRLVGYANLAVRPAPEVFGTLPFFHIDGADLTMARPMGEGLWQAKLYAGVVQEGAPYGGQLWDMGGSTILGGHIDLHQGPWSLRLGYTQLRLERDLPPYPGLLPVLRAAGASDLADSLSVAGKTSDFYALGLTWEEGPWRFQGILTHIQQQSISYQDTDAGALLAAYRLGQFTPYAGLAWSRGQDVSYDLTALPVPLQGLAQTALTFAHTDQLTWTLGLRWDFHRNMDLKVQWDWVRGRPDSLLLTRNEQLGWDGRTHVLSVALDFAF